MQSKSIVENQASFSFSQVSLTTKLIDGTFPDYNRVIPAETTTNIMLDTKNTQTGPSARLNSG